MRCFKVSFSYIDTVNALDSDNITEPYRQGRTLGRYQVFSSTFNIFIY